MKDNINSFDNFNKKMIDVVDHQCMDPSEVTSAKRYIQASYTQLAHTLHDTLFLNYGLWDKKIYKEYQLLDFDFSELSGINNINSQLLLYYLIRPLIKAQFFDKRLLEVGCGTGIGLRASSGMLATKYALGIDLVHEFAANASKSFAQENKINYIQCDAEHLAVENESFDIITNMESSHLYPKIEHFFAEIERVLAPGGFFCYSDLHYDSKQQGKRLEEFVTSQNNLKIIQKDNITKMVQASIYQRLIVNEALINEYAQYLFGDRRKDELPGLVFTSGLAFLPWWKIRFKNPELHPLAKITRKISYHYKKNYFYYLVQKIG